MLYERKIAIGNFNGTDVEVNFFNCTCTSVCYTNYLLFSNTHSGISFNLPNDHQSPWIWSLENPALLLIFLCYYAILVQFTSTECILDFTCYKISRNSGDVSLWQCKVEQHSHYTAFILYGKYVGKAWGVWLKCVTLPRAERKLKTHI